MYRYGRSEGECTQGEGRKVSVDVHATRTGADREPGLNYQGAEGGRSNVDKNSDRHVDIAVYAPTPVRDMSNGGEEHVGIDEGRCVHGSGTSAQIDYCEGSGNILRRLLCAEQAYRL